eukprot:GHVS01064693.1.p1 GENE.GHVS01064693.1~~GHVS01064693.1.p1  ORF type:complete len:113 (-),score=18.29 GHVS01064693.1:123-461(-)
MPCSFASANGSFYVDSSVGHKLSCVISQPDDDDDNCATERAAAADDVAVLCHGLFCSKDHHLMVHLARNLPISTVRFDFHGNGDSGGEEKWNFGGYVDEVKQDIRAVVTFLR